VAYLDDDAYPDPHWLTYLAATFMRTTHAGVGRPNLAPAGDGPIAESIAHAPGGPVHVLLSDQEAEHIPGCNMAFRKAALQAIRGIGSTFPHGGGRCVWVRGAAATLLDMGIPSCGNGLAPPPQLGVGLLETAKRLWEG